MGCAFARAFIASEVCASEEIVFIEPANERREQLTVADGYQVFSAIDEIAETPDVVVLAVKPQVADEVIQALAENVPGEPLTISIMAGVRLATLISKLGHSRVVRSMPNTPAQIGKGATVYISGTGVSDQDGVLVDRLLRCTGLALKVSEERFIDGATAVSGSGPGFVFYLIEHYLRAAENLGFSRDESEQLVISTFEGALQLWKTGDESPAQLRARVTSRAGTTEAGLRFFEDHKVGQNLCDGILAAYDRSIELGLGNEESEEGDE